MKLGMVLAGLTFGLVALAAESGAELFQKALTAERAAGNLEEAIKLYQRVAKEFASDRALAAKALVQEARCYEKLGQDNAVRIYERVSREYKDQPEPSATANARLAALKLSDRPAGSAGMTQRKIDLPFTTMNPPYRTDGRRQVYVDDATGALMISDLSGKDNRVIFKPKPGERIVGAILVSRDFSVVRFTKRSADGSRKSAVVKTDGTGYREIAQLTDRVSYANPDWSWDNRYIFTCTAGPDGARQVTRQGIADGELRRTPMPCGVLNRPSPDGRFIALWAGVRRLDYDKVSVARSEGGEPQLISDNARLIDWTRDGRYLILAQRRSDAEAMYLVPVRDGRRSGEPILLRYGSCGAGSVTADGSLVCIPAAPYRSDTSWLGSTDSSGRSVEWKELNLPLAGVTRPVTAWSPDSSRIAYLATGPSLGRDEREQVQGDYVLLLRLHDIASGEEREVYRGSDYPICAWPENARLVCAKQQPRPPIEMLSVSLDSGLMESLGQVPGFDGVPRAGTGGGQSIDIIREPNGELIRWDIATGQATSVDRLTGFSTQGTVIPSPTDRWLARRNREVIEIRPAAGGAWKPLISLPATHMAFTPDGKWLLFHAVDAAGSHSLFRVSTAGGQPERIGDFPSIPKDRGALLVSPDGRKLIADGRASDGIWILENFEPKQTAAR